MSLRLLNIVKIIVFLIPMFVLGQDRYWLFFTDKQESIDIYRDSDFLSELALERRAQQNIDIVTNDYPISPSYIQKVDELGFEIYRKSRWLNAVSILVNNPEDVGELRELPYVSKVQKVKKYYRHTPELEEVSDFVAVEETYGPSFGQIAQLNGHLVHQQGFKGEGRKVAVMDASFYLVDELLAFDSLWINNRIIDTWDFVLDQDIDYSIDTIGSHGTMVLSCMGAYMKDSIIGTAPEASYMLYRTEDTSSETLTEEDNWVAAAEQADLQGAHVINTSLGYSNLWDDWENTHTYADMDGNTTIITIAADIAASKGMLLVNSAGNSGGDEWYYITAPADGDSVLTIGAIDADSILTSFSSHGPTADGRMKPNIVAQGLFSVVCNLENGIRTAHGTSFSSPILAGMAASVWSAMPEVSSMDLFNLIQESAHLYPNGNNDYGYGVPNFNQVLQQVGIDEKTQNYLDVYPNPFTNYIILNLSEFDANSRIELSIVNQLGEQVYSGWASADSNYRVEIDENLPQAFYVLKAKQGVRTVYWKMIK